MDIKILEEEKQYLNDTKEWLGLELNRIKKNENEIKENISSLEKRSF